MFLPELFKDLKSTMEAEHVEAPDVRELEEEIMRMGGFDVLAGSVKTK